MLFSSRKTKGRHFETLKGVFISTLQGHIRVWEVRHNARGQTLAVRLRIMVELHICYHY